MAACHVRAIDSKGELLEFALPTDDPALILEELARRRANLISLRRSLHLPALSGLWRRSTMQIDLTVREMSSLLRAGLSIPESVSVLLEKETNAGHKSLLGRVLKRLEEGDRLSGAFAKEGKRFPPLLIAMTRASEDAASIATGFDRFLRYSALSQTLRRKIASALIYPVLLIGVALAVSVFLALFVVPRFASVFEEGTQAIPASTAALLQASRLLSAYGLEAAFALAALTALSWLAIHKGVVRPLGHLIERAPIIGAKVQVTRVSRFLMALSALLEAGVPLHRAIDLSKGVMPASWDGRLDAVRASVEAGFPLSDSLAKVGASTVVADRLLRVGERSGDLAGLAGQAARHHEEELERFLDRFMRLAEPLLMVVIGVIIGAVVIALYLPLFDLAQWIR
jgi:general secretion pathway protein F